MVEALRKRPVHSLRLVVNELVAVECQGTRPRYSLPRDRPDSRSSHRSSLSLASLMTTVTVTYEPRGAIRQLFLSSARQILVEGPADTGKTRGILELMHFLATRKPGMRALICRKTQKSLTSTVLLTYDEKVLHPGQGVTFFGGNDREPAGYKYPNGSRILVGGLDNMGKLLSSEFDFIFLNQAEETTEDDWENLTRACTGRAGTLDHPRLIGDCNPAHSSHYLMKRCISGLTQHIKSTHADNPSLTPGRLEALSMLTGTRRERLFLGNWTGIENSVYPAFDRNVHIRDLPGDIRFRDGAFGGDYGRVHKAAAVAISVDQYGRRWVREAWGEPDDEHGRKTVQHIGRLRAKYGLRRGCVDPNQDVLIGLLGYEGVRLATGARQSRIDAVERLLDIYPGGIVPSIAAEVRNRVQFGPFPADSDSPGLLFVKGAPGIEELADQMEAYHYVHQQTEMKDELVVARVDEDLVAAMEYGIQALSDLHPGALPSRWSLRYAS